MPTRRLFLATLMLAALASLGWSAPPGPRPGGGPRPMPAPRPVPRPGPKPQPKPTPKPRPKPGPQPRPGDKQQVEKIKEYLKPYRPKRSPLKVVKPFETHAFGQLDSRRVTNDGLTPDHIPSRAAVQKAVEGRLGRPLTKAESRALRDRLPTIVVPHEVHKAGPTYAGKNNAAQVARDAANLRAAFERDVKELRANALKQGHSREQVEKGVQRLRGRTEKMLRDLGL